MLTLEPIFFLSAFVAGVVMFLAPCTLPLLPAYLGFISGVTEKELQQNVGNGSAKVRVLKNSFFFVSGFSIILISSGVFAGVLGSFIPRSVTHFFSIAAGSLIVLFGLFMIGLLKIPFFQRERRIKMPSWLTVGTPLSSFLLGVAFALGWTPCIGPVYGTILIYASTTQTAFAGFLLLATFSLGFSVPLLGMALVIGHAASFVERLSPYVRVVSVIGGVALVFVGTTLLIGDTKLTNWFFGAFTHIHLDHFITPYL